MKRQDFTISWIGSVNTIDIINKTYDTRSPIFKPYQYKQQIFQKFEISLNSHHWTIMKDQQQLNTFSTYLQKQYPSKTKSTKIIPNAPTPKILNLIKLPQMDYNDENFIKFFEIYDLQFNKVKSLQLRKKSGGRYVDKLCCNCNLFQWKNRNFVITSNGILYHKQKHGQKKICQYISFNKYFQYNFGIETGYEFGINIKSYHRKLLLTAKNFIQYLKVLYYLDKAFQEYNNGRIHNMYNAFSASKDHNYVQFYVDGEEYFAAIAESISKAKYQVMIAGWWISPQFYLVRPIDPKNPQKNRFSSILKQIIQKNDVKIYILAYRQSPMFLPNDSNYTKQALQKISPNIKVITHPSNVIPSLWSHHQKLVIIDQQVAFTGGLDICYGRYDTNQHSIKDKQNLYPGIQFNNSRIKDFSKVREYQISNIMRSKHPRLPWHDISMKVIGQSVADISKHFIQYWNFASYESLYQERIVLVPESKKTTKKIQKFYEELKNRIFNSQEKPKKNEKVEKISKNKIPTSHKTKQLQKDQTNKSMIRQQMQDQIQAQKIDKIIQAKQGILQSGQDQVYRYTEHEVDAKTQKKQSSTNQTLNKQQQPFRSSLPETYKRLSIRKNIKKLFVPNRKDQEEYYDSDNGQYLNERSYQFQQQNQDKLRKKPGHFQHFLKKVVSYDDKQKRSSLRNSQTHELLKNLIKIDNCQVLRSVSKWSIGCKQNQSQSSIHQAYIDMIRKAQHFIYIENQFFMSAIQGQKVLKNHIAKALIERISKAIKQKKKFRVLVFMPLIPGFAGQLNDPQAIIPRVIMHWQYLTIYKGQNSIINSLKRLTPDPSKYIQFYGLRTHDIVNNQPRTQIIYIHSKLMIVDDRKAILGSANINDRSMRGTRDSEIAVKLQGGKQILSIVNGQDYKVSQKIYDLRIRLLKQHFGQIDLQDNSLDFRDILNSKLFDRIQKMAFQNTQTYRKIFGCYPDNQIQTLRQITKYQRKPSVEQYIQGCKKIYGQVVHFPLKFLCKQNLLQGNSMYPNSITT